MSDHFSAPRLNRISPKRIRLMPAIVAGRPYSSVDELEKVSGIGPKSLKDLRPYVKVEGEMEKLR